MTTFKRSITAALLVAGASICAPAFAQTVCSDSTATTGNAGYLDCQGPTAGNISPGQTNTATFDSVVYNLFGKSDDTSFGPFSADPGTGTSGTLTFDSAVIGMFVLGIKGGPNYSLYLFDGGATGISTLQYDTLGINTGSGRAGPGLGHLALFSASDDPFGVVLTVPEPETYAMMLAGLGLVGSIARRRKGKQA